MNLIVFHSKDDPSKVLAVRRIRDFVSIRELGRWAEFINHAEPGTTAVCLELMAETPEQIVEMLKGAPDE